MTDSSSFAELHLAPAVLSAIAKIGYEQPSPIQAQSIPHLLAGKDLLGLAQTGTGKTAAFALPLLSKIDPKLRQPQVLVLAPTRELAIQVAEAFQSYASEMSGTRVMAVYGGQDMRSQLRGLERGAHIIVGTPGRIMDHLRRGSLSLKQLKAVVLDEADEMLRMGFIDDVTWILDQTPEQRQVALFSATMPTAIERVAETYLDQPVEVKIAAKTATVERIEQKYWLARGTSKMDALTRILDAESVDAAIIFVRTKTSTTEVAEKLEARGYASSALNGDMNQAMRERAIERLKNGKLDIIVATDVAARGIDVARVSHVINYDIPYDNEAYVHRIGRTGRAGRSGTAILFVTPREKRLLYSIERTTRQKIAPMQLPSHAEIADKRVADFKQTVLNQSYEKPEFYQQIISDILSENTEISAEELAARLLVMAQKDRPLLPAKSDNKFKDKPPRERDSERRNDKHGDKHGKENRKKKERKPRAKEFDTDMDTFRIDVGREHGVKPGDIVGAIANEADIDSQYIGHIKLEDAYSLVDLPAGMPKELQKHLRGVWCKGQKLNLQKVDSSNPNIPRKMRKPKQEAEATDKPRKRARKKPQSS